jgi:hypothetical protein
MFTKQIHHAHRVPDCRDGTHVGTYKITSIRKWPIEHRGTLLRLCTITPNDGLAASERCSRESEGDPGVLTESTAAIES